MGASSPDPQPSHHPAHHPARLHGRLPAADRRARTSRALIARAATTDEGRRQALLEYAVELNMDVARSIASRYLHRGIDEDDLVQVAYAALTRAARDFDPARHHDLLSYAVPTIRGEVKKHFRDCGWTVRPPRRVQECQALIARAEGVLSQQLGRPPRPRELAEHLGLELDEVIEALSADGCFTPTSLDRRVPAGDDAEGTQLGDLLGDLDPGQPAAEARAALAPVVRMLKERDRRILYLRFFEDCTQQEIADELGVTQMQVSRLLSRIMRDLRLGLTAEGNRRTSRPVPRSDVPARRRGGAALVAVRNDSA